MGYGMKALRAVNRMVNEWEREERARARERERAYKIACKEHQKLLKLLYKARKEQAKYSEYIFDKDPKSKQDNENRLKAILQDYVFWQFFAIDRDKENASQEVKERLKEMHGGYGWKAEWRDE